MDRLRRLFRSEPPAYEPIDGGEQAEASQDDEKFSWIEYSIFFLLGIAMLWAWNMFLAAAPYFQHRFASSEWILTHFQSAILSVSCVTNLGSMLVLTKLQSGASYPKRIATALLLNTITFTLLAISTTSFRSVTAGGYFGFLLTMVCATSLSTGLSQNGVFAYVTGFGRGEYTQAIMAGQAVAGVLPCIAQIVSVLSVSQEEADDGSAQESPKSAFAYFLTATGISSISFIAFLYFVERHRKHRQTKRVAENIQEAEEEERAERKVVGLWTLFKKLHWIAGAVFICFAVTMVFPVFTQAIPSVRDPEHSPRILQPASFIPLGFLVWNLGDLIGRLLTLHPRLAILHYPRTLFIFSVARVGFIPLYLTCNLYGRGAVISSDFFYLVVVQLLFGMSNGYLGSLCMMSAGEWVEVEEREAAGGFMGLFLVAGLTVGSLLSFLAA